LVRILAHIPRTTGLRVLRLGDESVGELDEEWVQDMRGIPNGLKVLEWGKMVYEIERENGRVRGVKREGVVWIGWDERWGMNAV
jgi:hypothetical protein